MKTNSQHLLKQLSALTIAFGLSLISGQAQEQKDPYKKAATSAAAPVASEEASSPAEKNTEMTYCVTATVEWLDLSNADAMSLMRGGLAPNSAELIQKIRELESQGKATLVDAQSSTTKNGERSTTEGSKELIYPTEFDPIHTEGISHANVNLSNTQIKDGKIILQQDALSTAHPQAFEMRPTGGKIEFDLVVGPDGKTLDIRLAADYTVFTGFQDYGSVRLGGETVPLEKQPIFASSKITTTVTIISGQTIVAGMTTVHKDDGMVDTTKKRLLLVHGLVFPIHP